MHLFRAPDSTHYEGIFQNQIYFNTKVTDKRKQRIHFPDKMVYSFGKINTF